MIQHDEDTETSFREAVSDVRPLPALAPPPREPRPRPRARFRRLDDEQALKESLELSPGDWLIESKSLKLYLTSFRNHGSFHEDCTVKVARKIVEVATKEYGIPLEDLVIDPLAMPIGADHTLVWKTLETIRLIRDTYGLNMTLGASNVSFGMPDRHTINSVFLPMAMTVGLTSAIMDARTEAIVRSVKAGDLMMGNDEWGAAWISAHRARLAAAES